MLNGNKEWSVHPGPPKTLSRCLAKGTEYMLEFSQQQHLPRWTNFAEKFKNVFQRLPSKPEDFVWNIVDFARCSITVPDAADVMMVKRIVEKHFSVICVKNGYNSKLHVKGSGYRDLKLLIKVEFDNLQLGGITSAQKR